jgi:hypothetical protein
LKCAFFENGHCRVAHGLGKLPHQRKTAEEVKGGGTHVEVKEDFERGALARVKSGVVAVVVP